MDLSEKFTAACDLNEALRKNTFFFLTHVLNFFSTSVSNKMDPPKTISELKSFFASQLSANVDFWLHHGVDHEFGGIITALDREGNVFDSDKSVWFQGRAGWMFATIATEFPDDLMSPNSKETLVKAALSCCDFLVKHCRCAETGKYYFSVTRDGQPLRMRRYVFSESFAAIAFAAAFRLTGSETHKSLALEAFDVYLRYSFDPGVMLPKFEPTRPMRGIGALMIAIVTAQELRRCLGADAPVKGLTLTEWISKCIADIKQLFVKEDIKCVMECVAVDGSVIDHIDGRTLNPGHAIECSWFLLEEAQHRGDHELAKLGLQVLDWMWERGWDKEHGGLLYFTDVFHKPVQEYWHDMKFWWNHCEAIIATLMAFKATRDPKYLQRFHDVLGWSFRHFPDPQFGEWYGYLHRNGTVSQTAKGNMYKGPFHLPRMLLICWKLCSELAAAEN